MLPKTEYIQGFKVTYQSYNEATIRRLDLDTSLVVTSDECVQDLVYLILGVIDAYEWRDAKLEDTTVIDLKDYTEVV